MKKYYVLCGTLKEVVLANDPHDACVKALLKHLDPLCFHVDERGFRDCLLAHDEAELENVPQHLIWTDKILS